jgi:hypothetical protein
MAVKKRYVECECGELFTEGKSNQLEGTIAVSPWRLKESRKRQTKTTHQCDILIAVFERSVHCGKCKQELMREKRQYELTPPIAQNDEPVTSYSSRDFVIKAVVKQNDDLMIRGSAAYNTGDMIAVDQVMAEAGS